MSRENVEVVRRAYAHFNQTGQLPSELFDPHVEFDATRTLPDIGILKGRDRFLSLIAEYAGSFEDFHVSAEEVLDAGDQVVAVVRDGGRMKDGRSEIWNRFADVLTLRGGKIVRWTAYGDKAEALEAVGLRE